MTFKTEQKLVAVYPAHGGLLHHRIPCTRWVISEVFFCDCESGTQEPSRAMELHSEALAHAYSAGSRGLILAWLSWRVSSTLVAFSVPCCSRARPAMSSKVLCAWSWVCRANGRWWSLTGSSWHWALGVCPWPGYWDSSPFLCLLLPWDEWITLLPAACHLALPYRGLMATEGTTTDGNLWNP